MKRILTFGIFAAFIALIGSACNKNNDLIPNPNARDDDSLPDTITRVRFVISHTTNTPSAVIDGTRKVYKYGQEMNLLSVDVYTSDESGSVLYFLRTDEAQYSPNQIEVGTITYLLNDNGLVYQINQGTRTTEIDYNEENRKVTERNFKNEKLESEHRYSWKGNLMTKDSAYYPGQQYQLAIAHYSFKDESTPSINHGDLQLFGEVNEREPVRKITRYYDEAGIEKYTTYIKYLFDQVGDTVVREERFWNSIYVDSLSTYQTDTYSFEEL